MCGALLGVVIIPFSMAWTQTSALVKQVQPAPNSSSSEKLIMCAFALLKSENHGFRTSKGTDDCEELTFDQVTTLNNSSFEPEIEFFEVTTAIIEKTGFSYVEKVIHYLYSEVQVGDKFQFVIQKSDTDKFRVVFIDSERTKILLFYDTSISLEINDDNGIAETPPYPFSDFKEYKIVFEVLQSHWQIYVDDVALTNFVHRRPVQQVREIEIYTGPAVTYLTKAFDPRLTGQDD